MQEGFNIHCDGVCLYKLIKIFPKYYFMKSHLFVEIKKCQAYCLFALSMLSMTLEKWFFRVNQESNHIRKADQRQVVRNQLIQRALGTECSFSTLSVC